MDGSAPVPQEESKGLARVAHLTASLTRNDRVGRSSLGVETAKARMLNRVTPEADF